MMEEYVILKVLMLTSYGIKFRVTADGGLRREYRYTDDLFIDALVKLMLMLLVIVSELLVL